MKFLFLLFSAFPLFCGESLYLSGSTWWQFCDWKLTQPDFGNATHSHFSPLDVGIGDTIFVEYNCLQEFKDNYLPYLQHKVILITANYGYGADQPLPGPYAPLLESEKIAAWFVQNIDRPPTEKLIPIPIGLANPYWPHGNTQVLDQLIPQAHQNQERPLFVYLNFSLAPERIPCANHFSLLGIQQEPSKPYASYIEDLSRSRFVISPPGGGLDCHRTWEALLLGAYPVVKHSTLDPLYEHLPVVMIADWDQVTLEFLEREEERLKGRIWPLDRLYFPYWAQKVKDLQAPLKNSSIPAEICKHIELHAQSRPWEETYYDVLPKVIEEHSYRSILEVGVALGGHAETLLKNPAVAYLGIDPYSCYDPSDGFEQDVARYSSLSLQQNFDFLYHWVKEIRLKHFGKRCQLWRLDAQEAALMIQNETLDCIFIDGNHNYDAVLKDLDALFPKLKKGHLMIGDDYSMPAVARAVHDFFDAQGKEIFFLTAQSGYKLWAVYK